MKHRKPKRTLRIINDVLPLVRVPLPLYFSGEREYHTWLLMSFFKSIPKDIEERAMVDGCSRAGAMFWILLPLSIPGIITVVVFAFTLVAHEYIYALAFIQDSAKKTIGIGITTELVRGDVFYWGALMGGALIASVPVATLYPLFLDRIISGLAMGAVKR